MTIKRTLFASITLLILLSGLFPALAAGPVYKDLPDLEGQEIAIAVESHVHAESAEAAIACSTAVWLAPPDAPKRRRHKRLSRC